jgi:hypothetical protein
MKPLDKKQECQNPVLVGKDEFFRKDFFHYLNPEKNRRNEYVTLRKGKIACFIF